MTIHRRMIETIKTALGSMPSSDEVVSFTRSMQNADGGFRGRSSQSDLYYTMFASEILLAFGENDFTAKLETYLQNNTLPFGDIINLASIVRLFVDFMPRLARDRKHDILNNLEDFHCPDHGYSVYPGAESANIYGTFLALTVYQDLGTEMPEKQKLLDFIQTLRLADGSYVNHKKMPLGSAPATAAALLITHSLTGEILYDSADWLKSTFAPAGGCKAAPLSPQTDLLSTGVSLFALQTGADINELTDANVDYINSLREAGGFYSDANKTQADVEYTYYGLLGLGSLWQQRKK